MENVVKTVTVYAKEIKNGNTQFVANTTNINGNWYKVKFTKDCKESIKSRGIYELSAYVDDMSVERGKRGLNAKGKEVTYSPTIWVKSCVLLRKYTDEELKLRDRERMAEVFGD